MNRLLIRNIFAILIYTGFFTVQLGANFLIQENIKFRNDFNGLGKNDKNQKVTISFFKSNKNFSKHKKSNMNRRFIKEDINHFEFNKSTEQFVSEATISKAGLKNRLNSLSIFEIEDRGPPMFD
jgi:hypothetical protein